MLIDQNHALQARVELGLFLRGFREDFFARMGQPNKKTLSRRRLAGRAGKSVCESTISNLEHGVVNPERHVFESVIKSLKLSKEDTQTAFNLLDKFSVGPGPRKWKRRGYRAPFFKLVQRRMRRGGRR